MKTEMEETGCHWMTAMEVSARPAVQSVYLEVGPVSVFCFHPCPPIEDEEWEED